MLLLVFSLITSILFCSMFRRQDDPLIVAITWAIVTYFITVMFISPLNNTIVKEQKAKNLEVSDSGGFSYLLTMFEYNTPLAICTFFYTLLSVAVAFLAYNVIKGNVVYSVLINFVIVILVLDVLSLIFSIKKAAKKRNSLLILVYYQTWFLNRLVALLLKGVVLIALAPFIFLKFLIGLFFLWTQ